MLSKRTIRIRDRKPPATCRAVRWGWSGPAFLPSEGHWTGGRRVSPGSTRVEKGCRARPRCSPRQHFRRFCGRALSRSASRRSGNV